MRYGWLLVLVACGGGSGLPDGGRSCPMQPEGLPLCMDTCGNGRLDQCYTVVPPGGESTNPCYGYPITTEVCDGTMVSLSCQQDGYYGGTGACGVACAFDDSGCTACASDPRIVACDRVVASARTLVAPASTTGPQRLGLVSGSMTIVDLAAPAQPVAQVGLSAVAGIADGWLGATIGPTTIALSRIDLDGNVTAGATIPKDALLVSMAAGPNNRTLVAWTRIYSGYEAWFAVADGNGALVSAPAMLVNGSGAGSVSVSSDGTSFFVGVANGILYRIGADGTVLASTPGFPAGQSQFTVAASLITANASGGWYIVAVSHDPQPPTFLAQRFDTLGAPTGNAITIAPDGYVLQDNFRVDGTGLAMATSTLAADPIRSHQLVRIDATGAVVDTLEFGRGPGLEAFTSVGGQYIAAFSGASAERLVVIGP